MCFFKYFFSTTFKYNTTKSELFFWKFRYSIIHEHFSAIRKVSNCKFLLNKPKCLSTKSWEGTIRVLPTYLERSWDESRRDVTSSKWVGLHRPITKRPCHSPPFTILMLLFYDWNNLMIYFNFCCNTIIVVACGIRNSR